MDCLKNKAKNKARRHIVRKIRINAKIKSSLPEYRVIANKSNMYTSAQLIDVEWKVIALVNDKLMKWTKTEKAFQAWEKIATIAKSKGVEKVVFDRNGYLYHGRIKALADGLRKGWITL